MKTNKQTNVMDCLVKLNINDIKSDDTYVTTKNFLSDAVAEYGMEPSKESASDIIDAIMFDLIYFLSKGYSRELIACHKAYACVVTAACDVIGRDDVMEMVLEKVERYIFEN